MGVTRTTVKVEGLKELQAALEDLPKATSRNVLRRALLAGAAPIEATAEQLAPVKTGALRTSHTAGTKLSRRQKAVHRQWAGQQPAERTAQGFRSKPSDAVYVFVGPGGMPQAITQEFGTVDHAAHPFMRPAWDQNQHRALQIVVERIAVEIQTAVARIARKAEREAAKIKATTTKP